MFIAIKIVFFEQIANVFPGVVIQQQAAEYRAFCLQRMRRNTQLRDLGIGDAAQAQTRRGGQAVARLLLSAVFGHSRARRFADGFTRRFFGSHRCLGGCRLGIEPRHSRVIFAGKVFGRDIGRVVFVSHKGLGINIGLAEAFLSRGVFFLGHKGANHKGWDGA